MTTLLEALSNGSYDLKNTKSPGGNFSRKLQLYRDSIVSDYLKYKTDLNKAIAAIVKRDNLNEEQTKRIIEEVNNQVYLIKYNQMKNSYDRDVIFDIASLPEVNKIISGVDTTIKKPTSEGEEKAACEYGTFIEKIASASVDDKSELNAFNYTSHEFGDCSFVTRDPEKIFAQKLASEINDAEKEYDGAIEKIAENLEYISEAFVRYEQLGCDTQPIFNYMSKQANLNKSKQTVYKAAIEKKASDMKTTGETILEHKVALELCDISQSNDFSLGKYSMLKEATDKPDAPSVSVADGRKVIRDVNDLISLAMNAQNDMDSINKKRDVVKSLNKVAEIYGDRETLEKVAANGFAAFGKAFLGTNKKLARGKLNDAIKEVEKLKSDPRLSQIKSEIINDKAKLSKIKSGEHERMGAVKQNLGRARDELTHTVISHDNTLNEAATQGFIKRSLNSKYRNAKKDISSAKGNLNKAETMYKAQSDRISDDINKRIFDNQRRYNDTKQSLNLGGAKQKLSDAQKEYDKASDATKSARTVVGVGVGAPTALYANKKIKEKKENEQGPYMY